MSTIRTAPRLAWPLPALVVWALAWAVHLVALRSGLDALTSLALGAVSGAMLATLLAQGLRRRSIAASGFPLSALALAWAGSVPAWSWLAAGAVLLLAYPLRAWRDAPFFPTTARALQGLGGVVPLPEGARILDAGCGLGHGLQALRSEWPAARVHGIEWSALLAGWARRRCPWADVQRGDMWRSSWEGFDLVYLFQRPESMPRAQAKALAQMNPGAWLVSLEFEAVGWRPSAVLQTPGRRTVWVYRIGEQAPRQPG